MPYYSIFARKILSPQAKMQGKEIFSSQSNFPTWLNIGQDENKLSLSFTFLYGGVF
jgi:hypothetical protein